MEDALPFPLPASAGDVQLPTIEQGMETIHTCAWKAMQHYCQEGEPVLAYPHKHSCRDSWTFNLDETLFLKDMDTPLDDEPGSSGEVKFGHTYARDNGGTEECQAPDPIFQERRILKLPLSWGSVALPRTVY